MRAILRLVPLLAAAAVLHPFAAHTQRSVTIPHLHVPPVHVATVTASPDTTGLRFRVSEGERRGRERTAVAPSTQLAAADASRILARLPALRTPAAADASRILARLPALRTPAAADSFAFPARTLPAPRTGRILLAGFPPADTVGRTRPSGAREPAALTVVRAAPRGDVEVGAEVTITFSQPMVPLSSIRRVEEVPPPVRMTPQPKGRWRWLDVRTLVFTPQGRMPAATEYTVTIPAGTRSATGGRMAQDASWTFTTTPLTATGALPYNGGLPLKPLIVIRFNQRIDRAALLPHIRARVNSLRLGVPLRLATAQEIAADMIASRLAQRGDSVHWIALKPVRPLPRDASVEVSVGAGAPSGEGPLPTRIAQSWTFSTYGPLRLRDVTCGGRCAPGSNFVAGFTTELDTAAIRQDWVRVEPEIPGMRLSGNSSYLIISGETLPETTYIVHLNGGIRDRWGQTLSGQRTDTIRTGPALSPPVLAGFAGSMIVLDPAGPRRVSVSSQNIPRLRIRIHRVQPSDWPAFQTQVNQQQRSGAGSAIEMPGREVMNRVVDVGGEPGEGRETIIQLDQALGGETGHVIVGVEREGASADRRDQRTYAWVQSTRIGVAGYWDPEDVHAWATSLVDGTPLPGVRVTLADGDAHATTDAGGIARLRIPRPLSDGPEYLVAERDGDAALLPMNYRIRLGSAPGDERPLWYSLTDRNLYRPGEEVRFKGWVRRLVGGKTGGVELPSTPGGEIAWKATDARGNEIAAGTARLTPLGGFDAAFRIPQGANLGAGTIRLRHAGGGPDDPYGNLAFQVQEFRRPEYEVAMDAPAGPHLVGGHAEVAVQASYFAGGGLAGAPVDWSVVALPAYYTPPGWGTWRFGGEAGGGRGRGAELQATSFTGETDADGRHAVRLDLDRADPPLAYTLAAVAVVTDVNRQTWATSTQLLVHPAEVYVGLRTERSWIAAGESIGLGVVVVDLDGKVAAGRPVRVTAERLEWRGGASGWREVAVDSARCDVVSDVHPVSCAFATDTAGGSYRITAEVTDARGRPSRTGIRTWAWGRTPWRNGPGEEGEEEGNEQRVVRLIPDREEYAPGDTARVLVQLPFWPARGLLTVRREGIVRTDTITSDGPVTTVSIPITDADIPNLHLSMDVVGAHDREGRRQQTARGTDFATGQATLRIPPGSRTLRVKATPADSVQSPDSPSAVDVEVRNAAGRPVAGAEVAVVVVDEAVLALTMFGWGHPIDSFYPDWPASVMDSHLRHSVRIFSDSVGAPGVVWGTVVDARTRQPVTGAIVAVEGTERRAATDAAGRFALAGVPPGRRAVSVSRMGLAPVRVMVEVGEGPMPELRIELNAQIVLMEDVLIGRVHGAQVESAARQDFGLLLRAPVSINADPSTLYGARGRATPDIVVRTNFAPLALWAPVVRTDARGRARVPFTLPSNLTRYRVMAVAVSGGTLYGMDESSLTARQPLMVRPSAPRFLNFGDRCELPVVIQNQTDAPMDVRVAARGDGLVFADAGRRVTVPAHDRVEVRIPGEAVRAGTAHVQVAAVAGSMSDAAEITLPVYTPATAEAFATYGSIADGGPVELPLEVPDDAIPAFGGLEVTTSATALQELTDAFLYLVRYPYECAEQIASRLLAVAALRDVLTEFRAEGLPPPQALADSVARDLRVLEGMQREDGGFSFWPGADQQSWPYVSVHVTHALVRAGERGYTVPAPMLERAMDYVRDVEARTPDWYPESARLALRAYAAYVLDRAGDPHTDARLAGIYGQVRLDTIPLEMAGWLLSASTGRERFATERAELLRIVNNRATETASTATFATSYQEGEYLLLHSDRRTDAVVLEALLENDPQSELVTKTVRGLLGHRTAGRWENTQENGWVLLALDRYFRTYESQTPEFLAQVWLGERFAGEQRFTGRSADRGHLEVPMRALAADDPRSLTIGKDGPGRLYYRAGLRYAPRDLDLAPLDRGFAVERTYEAVDDSADVVRGADGRWRVKAGALVRITVTVTAPARRVHVAMVDPLPAGFEAVNTALRGAENVPPADDDVAPWERGHHWWWGPWYQHQNLRDDRVEAFTSLMPAGVYTYSYVARATTPGLFIVPPPRAEEMYSPETFGRGGTERVIVEAEEEEGRE